MGRATLAAVLAAVALLGGCSAPNISAPPLPDVEGAVQTPTPTVGCGTDKQD